MTMTWTCEQIEERLSEYVDGLLDAREGSAYTAHVAQCARCRPLVAQVQTLVSGLQSVAQVEPPPRLIYNILDKTIGPREAVTGWRAVLGWLGPFAQPKLVMGLVTVALTLAILTPALDIRWAQLEWADLQPANMYTAADRKVTLLYARSVKFVNGLRVVYEIQSRLQPVSTQQPAGEQRKDQNNPKQAEPNKSNNNNEKGRESNRAFDLIPMPTMLASTMAWPEGAIR
jgi:hypothetical protein